MIGPYVRSTGERKYFSSLASRAFWNSIRASWLQLESAEKSFFRFVQMALLRSHHAEIAPRIEAVRIVADDDTVRRGRRIVILFAEGVSRAKGHLAHVVGQARMIRVGAGRDR